MLQNVAIDKSILNHHGKEEKYTTMMEQRNPDRSSGGLVVIARNANGQIVTRITSRYEFVGALRTARSVLKLKSDAVCVEVHYQQGPTSTYLGKPLAIVSVDDLLLTHHYMS